MKCFHTRQSLEIRHLYKYCMTIQTYLQGQMTVTLKISLNTKTLILVNCFAIYQQCLVCRAAIIEVIYLFYTL